MATNSGNNTTERIWIKSDDPCCGSTAPKIQRWDDDDEHFAPSSTFPNIDRTLWNEFCDKVDAVFEPYVKYQILLALISMPSLVLIVVAFLLGSTWLWIIVFVVILVESAIQYGIFLWLRKKVEEQLHQLCNETSIHLQQQGGGGSISLKLVRASACDLGYYVELTSSDDDATMMTDAAAEEEDKSKAVKKKGIEDDVEAQQQQ